MIALTGAAVRAAPALLFIAIITSLFLALLSVKTSDGAANFNSSLSIYLTIAMHDTSLTNYW